MSNERKEQLLKILDKISDIKELEEIPGFLDESARLRNRLADDEFRIAVVGEFSSGKSTFINAMLGRDVLHHATTETTAVVTRIVNVAPDDSRRMTGRVTLLDGKQLLMSDLGNLKEFTTTQSERYKDRVPEEIDSVEIYLPFMSLSRPVVLVDTPGLNGMADGHREQTVALVQKAHACIYMIPRGGLGESDILFLTYLARFQKNFIFIQNFIDEFQASQGDSVPKKLEEQHTILEQKVFAQNLECVYDLCGVSALMELASADEHIDRLYADSPKPLTAKDRVRLHEQSGFEGFRDTMRKTFREDHMDEIQYGGTARAMANWIQSLLNYISKREQQAREFFKASRDKRALEKLERLREKVLAGEQRQRENLRNFIVAKGDAIRREECDNLKTALDDLDREISALINGIQTISRMEQFEKSLPGLLESRVGTVLADNNTRLRQKFQSLYQVLLTKIDEYSGVKSTEDLNLASLTINMVSEKQPSFTVAQNRIEKWKDELESRERESIALENESVRMAEELRTAQQSEDSVHRTRRNIEEQKNRQITNMGRRPAAEEREESYTDYVYRGGLGILDALFGPKEVTRYRTVYDDSKGEAWDRQRAKIQNDFAVKNDDLTKRLAAAQREKKRISARQDVNQAKLRSLEDKIRRLKQDIALESEKLRQEKELAAQEYLELRRSSLHQQVRSYLLGDSGILAQAEKNTAAAAEKIEHSFIKLAMDRFTQALHQKLQWIDQIKQEKSPEILRQADSLGEICQRLKSILTEVECG